MFDSAQADQSHPVVVMATFPYVYNMLVDAS